MPSNLNPSNRPVRTRMPGGVAGDISPLCRLTTALGYVSGKVIVTCSLPMDAGNTGLVIGHTNSGAEDLAKKVPKAKVVCAFNTVPSEVLFGVYEAKRRAKRPSLVYCGDDARSKDVAVIGDVGFDPIDVGPLRIAGYTEPFALLMGQLAYEGTHGPKLAYRFERFPE